MNRRLFEQVRDRRLTLTEGADEATRRAGLAVLINEINYITGLTDLEGQRHIDPETENHVLAESFTSKDGTAKKTISPMAINVGVLAEAVIGPDWKRQIGWDNDNSSFNSRKLMRLEEEAASPIGPSVFANVAAWTGATAGLMQAAFIEGYEQAPYEFEGLFPTRPAIFWQGGERIATFLGPSDPAPEVGIGEEYPDAGLSALWIEPGPMKKYGGKIPVARETAFVDISGGQILAKAKEGGQTIKFREQELKIDLITGQTNNFKLGMLNDAAATGYNTYGATILAPDGSGAAIPNDIVNPLNDPGAFTNSAENAGNLLHPVNGLPINVNLDTVILPNIMGPYSQWLLGADRITANNITTAGQNQAVGAGNFPNLSIDGVNPWKGVLGKVLESKYLHRRHVDSTTQTNPNRSAGLGLTGAAKYRWYRIDPTQFAARRVAWEPMNVDISPSDWVMAVQNIIACQVFSVGVMYQVMNVYAIQRNKGS